MTKEELKTLVEENNNIVYQNYFFDELKNASLIEFRNNINTVQSTNTTLYLEEKVNKYYDELLAQFDTETKLFKDYNELMYICITGQYEKLDDYKGEIFLVNDNIISKLKSYCKTNTNKDVIYKYLLNLTNQKISEIIIDRLFKDTFYNVMINLKEMLRYNRILEESEKILDNDKLHFYQTIIDIDSLNCNEKIALYNKYKNENINLMFYEDLRNVKDLSYQKIKQSMIKLNEHPNFRSKKLSEKSGVDVYDLTDKEYVMLVRTSNEYQEKTSSRRWCYSLISNENNKVYDSKHKKFIYGYSSFPNDCVTHIFESDAGVRDEQNDPLSVGTRKVNRLMTPEQLIKSDVSYNEINIVNIKNQDNDDLYDTMKPDFLVVFEKVPEEVIEESKKLNIPIAVIKPEQLSKINEEVQKYRYLLDDYTDDDFYAMEERRRNNR